MPQRSGYCSRVLWNWSCAAASGQDGLAGSYDGASDVFSYAYSLPLASGTVLLLQFPNSRLHCLMDGKLLLSCLGDFAQDLEDRLVG